jgi:thiol-disulfide isomerase/thioredoxin
MDLDETVGKAAILLEQVRQDYGDVPIAERRSFKTLGELAKGHLHEIGHLGIGKTAPKLASADLGGKPVQLDDFKGKVVVLDVWATWCGPCCAMIPHQREMVKQFEDKPFALVSISVDEDLKTLKDFLAKEPMPWNHWYNGPSGNIISDLNVQSYPTIYVLDGKGIIRYKDIRGKLLSEAVKILLTEIDQPK